MLAYSSYISVHIYMIFGGKCFSFALDDFLLLFCSWVCVWICFLQLFLKPPLSTFTLLPLEFMFPFLFTSATSGKNRDGNNFWCLTKDRNLHKGSPYCPNWDQNHHIWVSTGTKSLDLDCLSSFLLSLSVFVLSSPSLCFWLWHSFLYLHFITTSAT